MEFLYILAGLILLFIIAEFIIARIFFGIAMKPHPFDPYKYDPEKHPEIAMVAKRTDEARLALDNFVNEELELISRDGHVLKGTYYMVPDSEYTVAFFHGHNCNGMVDHGTEAVYYTGCGYSVFIADQRASGRSGGDYYTFGVKESADAVDWCRLITVRYSPKAIFLQGRSLGASTVMMSVSEGLPSSVKGIIADCGFTSPYEEFCHVLKRNYKIPGFLVLPVTELYCRLKAGYGFKDKDTRRILKTCTVPMLLIHGDADDYVPTYMTNENYAALECEKELLIVPGARHAEAFRLEFDMCMKKCVEFIEKHGKEK